MATDLLQLPQYSCFLIRSLSRQSTPRAVLRGTPTRFKIHCSVSTQNSQLTAEGNRKSAHYQPNMWNYDLLQSLNTDQQVEVYEDRKKQLKDRVRGMMNSEHAEPLEILELIDDIQRLGLGYKFEGEIRRALDRIASFKDETNKSLHATALCFRLLRQHGYEVSQDVFSSFKDQINGSFKASLSEDVKGMLSLYEASDFGFEGETLLDKAKEFTRMHLKHPKVNISKSLAQQVNHALELPLHRRMRRLETRWTIESHSKRQDANQVLLELAMLDFNMVQSQHQKELRDMSRWWRAMGLSNKLSFARDRLMECFFWSLGMVSEPQFNNCRKSLTKIVKMITILDDVYDVYGTVDELELFTAAVERWDVNIITDLPDYMKFCFLALYNCVNEMAYDILKEQGEVVLSHLTKAWADLLKSFLQEAKWCYSNQTPKFEEYLENAWMSSSGPLLLVSSYFLQGQNITKEALECLENYHDLLRWPSVIFRLCNDIVSAKSEIERGDPTGILCYMRETGVSEELARKHISNLIDEAWKKMNKGGITNGSPFGKVFVETAINVARQAHCHYQYGDGHGAPNERSRNQVTSLLIDPIQLSERPISLVGR